MEIKIFELSVEEQLRTFEQMNFEIAKGYESNLERAKKVLSELEEVVFKYDLPLPKYELTLRQIVQIEGIYTRALNYEIDLGPDGYTYSNHRIDYYYNKYIEYITKSLLTLSKYKEILVATIEKIKANKVKLLTSTEQKGFDLDLSEPQLNSLHQQLVNEGFLAKNTNQEHFINAFNGEVLKDFERLEWHKSKVVLTIFIGAIDSFKEQENKWQKTQLVFKDVNANNLRKTYSSQSELKKHKTSNLLFIQMLDGLRTV